MRAGVRKLLKALKLDGAINPLGSMKETQSKLELALAWCEQEGATTVEDLFDLPPEEKDSFIAALQLKPIKVRQLRKQLDAPMPAASATSSKKMNAKI